MRSHRYPRPHQAPSSAFAGYRFPPEVITLAVRWYLRFGLSFRDVEELLAERGVEVDHVTVYRWVHRFAPEFVEAASCSSHRRCHSRVMFARAGALTEGSGSCVAAWRSHYRDPSSAISSAARPSFEVW